MGSDYQTAQNVIIAAKFQSTLPAWGATILVAKIFRGKDISIHAPRMGSDEIHRHARGVHDISIHAPRMGSDKASGT